MRQFFLLFLLTFLTACSGVSISSWLDEIDGYVDSDPQAALAALTELDMGGVRLPRVKAHYSLLHSKALDKCYIDTTDTAVVLDAVNYYSRHGSPDERLQSLYYLGRIHVNAGRYAESIIVLTRALEEGNASSDAKYKGMVYIAMADAYNRNYNVVEEGKCVDKALEYFGASRDSNQIRAALSRKAVNCINLNDFRTADSLYKHLLAIPDLKPHLRGNCLYHYAYLLALCDDQDYQKVKNMFEDAIHIGAKLTEEAVSAYAYILWCVGDSAGSEQMFRTLEQQDSSVVGITAWWKRLIKEKQGQYREAYDYLKETVDYNAEGVNKALQQSLSVAQRDYYSAVAEQRKAEAKSSRAISMLVAATMISALLLLVYVGVNAIRRGKERNLQILSDLEYVQDRLAATRQSVQDRQAEIASLQTKFREVFKRHFLLLAQLYEKYKMNNSQEGDEIKIYKQVQGVFKAIRGEEETDHIFEKIIDRDMDGLVSRFRRDYPDLKEVEYLLFCYYVAGYDAKTISIILTDISPYALDTRKSRLKKMVRDSDVPDKEEYLKYF